MADMMPKKNYDLTEITRLLLAMRNSHIPRSGASYDALNAAIDLINNPSLLTKWISVKDRLPKPFSDVLIVLHGRILDSTVDIAWFDNNGYELRNGQTFYKNEDIITHWMPLPEPPKEEE